MKHVAILKQPFFDMILSGDKTIESRFLMNKIVPFNKVSIGDEIYLKQTGKQVTAKAEVEKVRAWCKEGNASFKIQTTEAGFSRDGVTISGATTKLVLDKELEEIKKELEALLNELSDLH